MNSKHRKTLAAVFAKQIRRNIAYRDVESLLRALNCAKLEGEGSRVEFSRDTSRLQLHRPHPGKEIKEYQVKRLQAFLLEIGVKP